MKSFIVLVLFLSISACSTNNVSRKKISIDSLFNKKSRHLIKRQTKAYKKIERIWLSLANHSGKTSCRVNIEISRTGEITTYNPINCPDEKRMLKSLEIASPLPGYNRDSEIYISTIELMLTEK